MSTPVTFVLGTLAGENCFTNRQADAQALVDALTGTLPSTYTQLITQDATPGAGDRDKFWLRTSSGAPIELLLWLASAAAWVKLFSLPVYSVTTGAANAYAVTSTVPKDAYRTGDFLIAKSNHTNTGAATLNIDALGVKDIKKNVSDALVANDILNNKILLLVYDGTNFQLLNPAMETTIAAADISPGTDGQFLSTVSGASAWQTRIYSTAAGAEQAIPAIGGEVTLGHGLGQVPANFNAFLKCTDAGGDASYAQNDLVPVSSVRQDATDDHAGPLTAWADATNVHVVYSSAFGGVLTVRNKGSGASATVTNAKWKIVAFAQK